MSRNTGKRYSSDEVRSMVASGNRDFHDAIRGRKVTICGFDLDCGCTGYADIWDEEAIDHEFVGMVDLSCLDPAAVSHESRSTIRLCSY